MAFVTALQEAGFFVFLFFLREGVFHWCDGLAPRPRRPGLGRSILDPPGGGRGGGGPTPACRPRPLLYLLPRPDTSGHLTRRRPLPPGAGRADARPGSVLRPLVEEPAGPVLAARQGPRCCSEPVMAAVIPEGSSQWGNVGLFFLPLHGTAQERTPRRPDAPAGPPEPAPREHSAADLLAHRAGAGLVCLWCKTCALLARVFFKSFYLFLKYVT